MKEQWTVLKKCLLNVMCDVVGELRSKQGRHGIHRK